MPAKDEERHKLNELLKRRMEEAHAALARIIAFNLFTKGELYYGKRKTNVKLRKERDL